MFLLFNTELLGIICIFH